MSVRNRLIASQLVDLVPLYVPPPERIPLRQGARAKLERAELLDDQIRNRRGARARVDQPMRRSDNDALRELGANGGGAIANAQPAVAAAEARKARASA